MKYWLPQNSPFQAKLMQKVENIDVSFRLHGELKYSKVFLWNSSNVLIRIEERRINDPFYKTLSKQGYRSKTESGKAKFMVSSWQGLGTKLEISTVSKSNDNSCSAC